MKIFKKIEDLKKFNEENKFDLIATSGAFDPLHSGHISCFEEIKNLKKENEKLVVIVNGDNFLKRKKGYSFMNHEERMRIISMLEGVDYVVPWDDDSQTVSKALFEIKPKKFIKGGIERKDAETIPEFEVCKEIDCEIVTGVGGVIKTQSSTLLVDKVNNAYKDFYNIQNVGVNKHNVVDKPWGNERIVINNEKYVLKILTILDGNQLSRQYHEVKDETILVLKGTVCVEIGHPVKQTIFLSPGEILRIKPGTIHRFKSWFCNAKVLEVSTPELYDVVRIEDDYNRVGNKF